MAPSLTLALAAILVGSAALAYLLTRLAEYLAARLEFLDRPAGRKAHERPTPFGGGSAVLATVAAAFLTGWAAAALLAAQPEWAALLPGELTVHLPGLLRKAPLMAGLLAVAAGLHVMGLWDDARGLSPLPKLLAQLTAAAVAVLVLDVRATFFVPLPGINALGSILWIALICNSFNFLDNMDGLCAGVAALCGSVLLTAALLGGELFIAALLCALVGACLGFLGRNFPPASVFLGDAGSQVIGFLLGSVTLLATYYGGRGGAAPDAASGVGETAARGAILIPVVALAVPLYDTVSVIAIRLRAGVAPWVGDRQHLSHRLRARGLSVRQTLLLIYLCVIAASAGAVMLGRVPTWQALIIGGQSLAVLGVLATLELTAVPPNNSESS